MFSKFIVFNLLVALFLGLFLGCSTSALSQQYAKRGIWKIGGGELDVGNDIEPTKDGGYVIAGYTFSYGAGFCDFYISKMDKLGVLEWTKVIGTSDLEFGQSVKQSSDQSIIVSGRLLSNTTGQVSAFVVKLDVLGNVLWQKTYSENNGNSICLTADGGYAIAGEKFGKLSVFKIDGDGNLQWSKFYGGTQYDVAKSIRQTTDGGFFVVGSTNSFGSGGFDVYAIKLDIDGNIEWTRTIGDSEDNIGESGEQTNDGGYILAGFTNVPANNGNPSHTNGHIIKLSANGKLVWSKSIGGVKDEYIFSIQQTTDGGFITGGFSNSFAASGATTFADSASFYVVKTNNTGNVQWSKAFSHQSNVWNVNNGTYGIRQTSDGGYVGVGSSFISDTNYDTDVFIVKLDNLGNSCEGIDVSSTVLQGPENMTIDNGTATDYVPVMLNIGQVTSGGNMQQECLVDSIFSPSGINELLQNNQFLIYPNPAYNKVIIKQTEQSAQLLSYIEIYNVLGQKVVDIPVAENNTTEKEVDVQMLSPGMYYFKFTNQKGAIEIQKFIKK